MARASSQYDVRTAADNGPGGSIASEEALSRYLRAWAEAQLRYPAVRYCARVVLERDVVVRPVFVEVAGVEAGSAGATFPAPVAAWSCALRATPRGLQGASFRQAGKQSGLPVAL